MSGVEIRVRANAKQAQSELRSLGASLGRLETNANKLTKTFQRMALGLTGVFAGGKLTQSITRSADAMTDMANKVNLVTKNAGQTAVVMNKLFSVAERSRGSVSGATEVFGRFGLALKGTGTTSEELLQVVETVQQAAAISGSSAETAKNAIIQLGQGLSSGQLRGEELNSVLEGMPRLAEAIADGMGLAFGELRTAAKDGLLTAEDVFAAIIDGGEAMQKEFDTLKATTSQLGTVLSNEFTRAIANLDKEVLGISAGIKDGLRVGIAAVKFFGANIATFANLASAEFLILRLNIKYFAQDVFGFLSDLFTGKISPDVLIQSVADGLAAVKTKVTEGGDFAIQFTVKKFNILKDMLPNLNEAQRVIAGFTAYIEELFKKLYKAVVGDSWWTGIFDKGHGEGGTAIGDTGNWGKHLTTAKEYISNWVDGLTTVFSNLYTSVTTKWAELGVYLSTNSLTPSSISAESVSAEFDNQIENIKTSWGELIEWMESPAQVMTPGGLEEVETTTGKAFRKIRKSYKDLTKKESFDPFGDAVVVDSALVSSFKDTFSKIAETVSNNYKAALDVVKSTPIVVGLVSVGTSIAGSFDETVSSIKDYFAVNKDVIGLAVGTGIAAALNTSVRQVLLKGAIVGLFVKAIATVGQDGLFLEAIRSQAAGFGKLLADAVTGEGDLVGDFLTGVKNIAKSLGEGLIDGMFGEDFKSVFADKAAAAIVLAIGAILLTKKAGLIAAILPLGSWIAKRIAGSLIATELAAGLTKGLTDGLTQTKANKGWAKAAGNLGFSMGTKIQGSLIAGLTIGLAAAVSAAFASALVAGDKLVAARNIPGTIKKTEEAASAQQLGDDSAVKTAATDIAFSISSKVGTLNLFEGLETETLEYQRTLLQSQLELKKGNNVFTQALNKLDPVFTGFEKAIVRLTTEIDKRGVSATTPKTNAFATGGAVNGPGTSTSDDIPAMLSNGEFVMRASAVSKFGPDFMSKLNQGIMPQFRSEGGLISNQVQLTQSNLEKQLGVARSKNDTQGALALIRAIKALGASTEAQTEALLNGNAEEVAATSADIKATTGSAASAAASRRLDAKAAATDYADKFKGDFAASLSEALRTGDVKGFLTNIADSFTMGIIDSFSESFTDSLFGDNSFFDKIFSGSISLGSKTGEKVASGIAKGTKKGIEGASGEGGLMSTLSTTFTNLFKGIGDMLGGMGGGGSGILGALGGMGGGGGLFSSLTGGSFGAFLGFSQGGTVPNTPFSQAGKDSVPAMLMPGEQVLSKNQVANMASGNTKQESVFNINVSGDVSRQTRQEIVKMMPQIAGGVNMQNKENNYKR